MKVFYNKQKGFFPNIGLGALWLTFVMDQVYDRDFRRGHETHRRPPRPRSPADVQCRSVRELVPPAVEGKYQAYEKGEGEYLPFMGMAGELEVKQCR